MITPMVGDGLNSITLRQFRLLESALFSDETVMATGTVSSAITRVNSGSATTQTLPPANGYKGFILIKNIGAGVVTVDGAGSETIDGVASQTLAQYDSVFLISDDSNWHNLLGSKTFDSSTLKLEEAGGTDAVTIAVASLAAARTYTLPDAGAAASFVMTAGTQTISGTKTFDGQLIGKGTATNDNAAASYIGEQVRAILLEASRISAATTNQFGDITSISLTAGDWDVTGIAAFALNGATATEAVGAVSVNTANTTTDHVPADNQVGCVAPTATLVSSATISAYRLSLSATTTVYLKGRMTYSAGTPQIYGRISARRVR